MSLQRGVSPLKRQLCTQTYTPALTLSHKEQGLDLAHLHTECWEKIYCKFVPENIRTSIKIKTDSLAVND